MDEAALKALPSPSLEELECALKTLLDLLVRTREEAALKNDGEREDGECKFEVITAAQLRRTSDDVLDERAWVNAPIDYALKQGMREIGKRLAQRVGTRHALLEVAERVAGDHDYGHRVGILDKVFDGIRTPDGDIWLA